MNKIIDESIKQNRYLFIAGICFLIYSIIEITDCIFLILIILNLAPNLYLSLGIIIPEIQQILGNQPIYFLPFFLSFTLMRAYATIGILKNILWGFYIGVISLILTMIMTILFMPFGFFELFCCTVILLFLLLGYFEKKPIVN
ncbi:MAG: hypothetical protein ACFFCV_17390 [Promethearchaeota archaeon]